MKRSRTWLNGLTQWSVKRDSILRLIGQRLFLELAAHGTPVRAYVLDAVRAVEAAGGTFDSRLEVRRVDVAAAVQHAYELKSVGGFVVAKIQIVVAEWMAAHP
jgi:hypothetical protein